MRAAVDAQRAAGARDEKQQRHPRIAHDVAQRVAAVVAATLRHHQRLLVMDANEARQVAARRAVQPLRPAGRERRERRLVHQRPIGRRDPVRDLDRRGIVGKAVDGLELLDGRDNGHFRFPFQSSHFSFLMTRTSWRAWYSALPVLTIVAAGAAETSSTVRRRRFSTMPSLLRARIAIRSARTFGGAVIETTTTSA